MSAAVRAQSPEACGRRFQPGPSDVCRSRGANGCRGPQREPSLSSALTLQTEVAHKHVHTSLASEMVCELFGEIHGPMLSAGAAERHHQIFETPALVGTDTRIHKRRSVCEKLMRRLLLKEVFDDRRVLPGQVPVALFPPRIRYAAAIEHKPAAMPGLVLRMQSMK